MIDQIPREYKFLFVSTKDGSEGVNIRIQEPRCSSWCGGHLRGQFWVLGDKEREEGLVSVKHPEA